MFTRSEEDDVGDCPLLYDDPADFDRRTIKEFWSLLNYVYEAGAHGASWSSIFKDGRLFHAVHKFDVFRTDEQGVRHQKTVEVFQFKKRKADIRVLMIHSGIGQLNLFVSHAFQKESATTPKSEQSRAESNIRAFLQACDENDVQLIASQGGKAATPDFT